MAKLIVLGTSSAITDKDHENTHFLLKGGKISVLIDCVGNPLLRLEQAGIELETINDIILTHCHPDHISGVPSFLMSMWLLGRKAPLNLHGLHHTLDCVEKMMDLYEWEDWPDFFLVNFNRLPTEEKALVLENEELRIFSSPVCHIVPTIGLRIESLQTRKVIAYSCDTEPCSAVIEMGRGADILIHEATGQSFGHSSSAQAGDVAKQAGAKSLYLIHYPPHQFGSQDVLDQAAENFPGDVKFAEDFLEFKF